MKALAASLLVTTLASQNPEAKAWKAEYLQPPPDTAIEVGGMAFLPDGTLAVSTRCGQVWFVDHVLDADPKAVRWRLFAEGLDEGLGLAVKDGALFVLQRGELSRLVDKDGDGHCDRIERVAAGWGLSGNYHEFAYGLPVDAAGNFYATLNLGFLDKAWWHGKSLGRWRGWALRITPQGVVQPIASGFRSPDGVALSPHGDLFVTDNQGDWMPCCGVFHVREGRFYSHPAGLRWPSDVDPSDTVPPKADRTPPAVWIPYGLSRSTGNLAWDTSGGKFGPFAGDCFAAELTNGLVVRLLLEKVRGEWQGAALAFRHDVGSAHRLLFAPDGTLLIGLTNRGWGGAGKAHGITRVRFTGDTPMEITKCALVADGFDLTFTHKVTSEPAALSATLQLYDYAWWWKYGSPEFLRDPLPCTLTRNGNTLAVRVPKGRLEAGYCARLVLSGVVGDGGRPLLHEQIDYTIHQLVDGPPATKLVAREVVPPKTREQEAEGWVQVHDAATLGGFAKHDGWKLADSPGIGGDTGKLVPKAARDAQPGALLCESGPAELVTRFPHGDAHVRLEFMLPRGGKAQVLLQGRYGIVLADTLLGSTDAESCGAIVCGTQRVAPRQQTYEHAGEWNSLDVWFEAPNLLPDGTRNRKARIARVEINHRVEINQSKLVVDPDRWRIHEDVDVEAEDERAEAPLVIRTEGPLALRRLEFRALKDTSTERAVRTFTGPELVHALPDLPVDETLRLACRLGAGGDAVLTVDGVGVRLNRSRAAQKEKSGSLVGLAAVTSNLIPLDDTWFELEVVRRSKLAQVRVNGILVAQSAVPEGSGKSAVTLERHDAATVVELR